VYCDAECLGLVGAGHCLGMCGGIAVWTIGLRYAAGLL
ncbi:MAG: sulfite exporter TauE/SafE, partial [Halioglobus sp.]